MILNERIKLNREQKEAYIYFNSDIAVIKEKAVSVLEHDGYFAYKFNDNSEIWIDKLNDFNRSITYLEEGN